MRETEKDDNESDVIVSNEIPVTHAYSLFLSNSEETEEKIVKINLIL